MATPSEIGSVMRGTNEDICAYYEAQVASWIAQLEQIRSLPEAVAHQPGDRAASSDAAQGG